MKDRFEACGKIFWLWSNSELHKSWPTALQTRFVLPAVLHNQFHIIEDDGMPVAYCSWARLTLDAEEKFILDPANLDPSEWTAGDRLWFIDWISPFGPKYTWRLQRAMSREFPKEVARAFRVKTKSTKARIATFAGTELTRDQSHEARRNYHKDLMSRLQAKAHEVDAIKVS